MQHEHWRNSKSNRKSIEGSKNFETAKSEKVKVESEIILRKGEEEAFLCSKALKDKLSKSDPSCLEIDDRHLKNTHCRCTSTDAADAAAANADAAVDAAAAPNAAAAAANAADT